MLVSESRYHLGKISCNGKSLKDFNVLFFLGTCFSVFFRVRWCSFLFNSISLRRWSCPRLFRSCSWLLRVLLLINLSLRQILPWRQVRRALRRSNRPSRRLHLRFALVARLRAWTLIRIRTGPIIHRRAPVPSLPLRRRRCLLRLSWKLSLHRRLRLHRSSTLTRNITLLS